MKSKSFKFITLPLLILMLLSITYSALKENGGEWNWNMEKLLDYIPFFGSSQSQPKTKIIYYIPNTQTQSVYVGDGKWNFKIATKKGSYELPWRGRTNARHTQVPVIGERCRSTTLPLLPCKNTTYYGGILVNSLPNHSAVKSDKRGCVEISLNLPEAIRKVKGKKVKLIFTFIS